ncbi:MAG: GNAT family N-acetyltransferase [Chloroflexota bacterium]
MIAIRTTSPDDEPAILRIASSEPLFDHDDVACVRELLTDYLLRPDHSDYFFLSAEDAGQLVGFVCYGPTPLTIGTFDLYWICVDRGSARQGIGRALIERVEQEVRQARGRLIVVETSGLDSYAPTRAFYQSLGYQRAAEVPEFYGPGDSLVIYTRRLGEG